VVSNWIAETLGVIEDLRLGLSPCLVDPLFDLFTLEAEEERLSYRPIPACCLALKTEPLHWLIQLIF
jgi:hypothetical protein